MSIIPYNNNKDVLYHNPNDGIMVVHDPHKNTIKLLSTVASETQRESNESKQTRRPSRVFNNDQFPHNTSMTKCPNCGFTWNEFSNARSRRSSSHSSSGHFNISLPQEYLSQSFIHTDYFKLIGKLPYSEEHTCKLTLNNSLPEGVFNQGYFKRFFKKIDPYTLGSGAHAQVYKVNHVLNNIVLGTYAVKKINIGGQLEFLQQVLNEVLILYELSTTGANENNLIRYNHVWLEMGELDDLNSIFFQTPKSADRKEIKVPYVFILQQYCDGGHLEDLIKRNFTIKENLTWKEKVELERKKRRAVKLGDETIPKGKQWLSTFEIWKFFHDVANGVNYLHHNGILHRDMKPSNCLLDVKYVSQEIKLTFESQEDFEQHLYKLPRVLVSDFGEGKFIEKRQNINLENLSDRQGNTGTLEFTAPELWLYACDPKFGNDGKKFYNDFTYESDIYSLGLILCYLCIGKLPFSDIIRDENDPQEARTKIMNWYNNLRFASFSEWFESQIHDREGVMDECMADFQKLAYKMIKGEDEVVVVGGGSTTSRIGSKDVLLYLNNIKWERFINTGHTFTSSDSRSINNELAIIEKDDRDLYSFNKDYVPSLLQNEEFSDDDDIEYEGQHDFDHINLTEDEFEDDLSRSYHESADPVKSDFFQIDTFKTVPIYCIELVLLEYLSFYSLSFSKSTLKLCIFSSIGLDIFVIERTKLRTMLFLLLSIVLSILLAYELGHLNPYIV